MSYTFKDLLEWYIKQAQPMQEINDNLVYRPNKKRVSFVNLEPNVMHE